MAQTRNGINIQAIEYTDEDGARYGVKQVNGKLRTSSMPYLYDIAEGNVSGHTGFRAFGHNASVAGAWETVHGTSNLRPYLAAGERLQVTSDDADDGGAPVGDGRGPSPSPGWTTITMH